MSAQWCPLQLLLDFPVAAHSRVEWEVSPQVRAILIYGETPVFHLAIAFS